MVIFIHEFFATRFFPLTSPQLSFSGGATIVYELPLYPSNRPIAPMLYALPDYAQKMSGKLHVELRVALSDSVRVGLNDAEAHVQLRSCDEPWTLLRIKRNLMEFHGIDWALDEQTTCRFQPQIALEQDIDATILSPEVVLTLTPPPRLMVHNFPLLLIQPFVPPVASEKKSKMCLVVVVGDKDIEVLSPPATVVELKAMLQRDHGLDWAVASSRCVNELSGKVLKDDSPVPATGRLKLMKKI